MSSVIDFRPKDRHTADKQISEYIDWAKRLGNSFDKPHSPFKWDEIDWGPWIKGCLFVKLGISGRNYDVNKDVLDPDIIDFAKACVVSTQTLNKTRNNSILVAIRAVEKALLELNGKIDITLINSAVYDLAGSIIQEHYKDATAYRYGKQLEKLSKLIVEKKLSVSAHEWSSNIKRPNDAHGHKKNKEAAKNKMPTNESLNALAEIWQAEPSDHRDIFVTSNCGILLGAPGRVSELNILAVDCLQYKKNKDAKSELFVTWYGVKGFGFTEKPIPEVLVPIVEESISRLKKITDKPRDLAKFLEENPNDFPFHDYCPNVGQDTILTCNEILDLMCISYSKNKSNRGILKKWLRDNINKLENSNKEYKSLKYLKETLSGMFEGKWSEDKIDYITLTPRKLNILVREFWLPENFPYTNSSKKMKYKDALNCFYEGQFNAAGAGYLKLFSIQQIDNNMLNSSLSYRDSNTGKSKSESLNIFNRWGYVGDDYSITTHQFRHYLNTIAAKGKVGELERARWSARADIKQNKVYNHMTNEEHVNNLRSVGIGAQRTTLATLSRNNEPILLKDLEVDEDRIAHYTLYGVCVHDFAMEPCTKYRDCISCKKHKCIKGDDEKERRIRILKDGLERQLKQAALGVDKEFYGADKWLSNAINKLEKVNGLLKIFDNPEVPEGAVITCKDNQYSPLQKSLAAQGKLPTQDNDLISSDKPVKDQDLTKIMNLLGR